MRWLPLRLTGRLDEPDWARAQPAAGFRQREPREGEPATQPTEVRVLYDASNLYIGVLARDSEPKGVVAHLRQRDTLLTPTGFDDSYEFAGDDAVAILLDPFRDKRNAWPKLMGLGPSGRGLPTSRTARLPVWREITAAVVADTPVRLLLKLVTKSSG